MAILMLGICYLIFGVEKEVLIYAFAALVVFGLPVIVVFGLAGLIAGLRWLFSGGPKRGN